jgi:predicted Zn-dependent peptidase
LEKINKVTLDEVNDLAKELIKTGEVRLAVIGPYRDKKKFESLV